MTITKWLVLYPSCVMAILMVTRLAFPFDPLRRWLARSAEISTDVYGSGWVVQRMGQTISPVASTKSKAWFIAEVGRGERVRRFASDLTSCAWCFGAWASGALIVAAAVEASDVGLLVWWPCLWLASSATCVILGAIAER